MSKNSHCVMAHEVAFIIKEVNRLPLEDLNDIYGIEILEDGTVYDSAYNKTFIGVGEWAVFNVEQDATRYTEHFHKGEMEEY